eukprot:CAMPEP_0175925946 /NCGR_PEP_ID=MMETSP0108-20121206/15915_1 /TAXON_ID=195067 ORGANISM="Goniomonas pacifica, Strain CCMP1869" /NCGR_SAMPLE_ID=MMETSP0108 /ASSEMBLY_ACC=CAM_ASM_000204 /LENGTH=91 /DNA_ID=CAMNT_0017249127 /DNA_START=69 /DNA_END=344 /DNA_ORIENTATION=-
MAEGKLGEKRRREAVQSPPRRSQCRYKRHILCICIPESIHHPCFAKRSPQPQVAQSRLHMHHTPFAALGLSAWLHQGDGHLVGVEPLELAK